MVKKLLLIVCLGYTLFASDIQKGETYYSFLLEDSLKYDAKSFAKKHTIKEWDEMFKDEGYLLKQELLKENSELSEILKERSFNESLDYLKTYVKTNALDARVFPTCE